MIPPALETFPMNTRTLLLALLCAACAFGYVYGLTAYGPAVHKALVPAR